MAFKSNAIYECTYCGERFASKAIYCKDCRTQPGRKAIFDANVAIAQDLKARGYNVPAGFRNWETRQRI